MLNNIKNSDDAEAGLLEIVNKLHQKGPHDSIILEQLSYYKLFHAEIFTYYEERIISAIGLFYKIKKSNNLYSFLMSGIGHQHVKDHGSRLTPVQASIRRAVDTFQYSSISAPTSAGKSFSIRDLIADSSGDAVIVVPSRALIAEYVNSLKAKFIGSKDIMISSFVDRVFNARNMRRVFVITPERSKDLFLLKEKFDVKIFFFDEAQISEEPVRGVVFDVMVRRVKKYFENSKIIFAHPFVENPEAQLLKHKIPDGDGFFRSYPYGAVGRICVFKNKKDKYFYFSPYIEKCHLQKNCIEISESFKDFALNGKNSVLVYVSKSSLYKGSFLDEFKSYINSLPEIFDHGAIEIINRIAFMVGADAHDHKSEMISLLKKGVVIHHGSVPLEVRFLIEKFIRAGHASLCFATSTLAQGVNMPFDIVWLENSRFNGDEYERALSFKNLIGRAGRLSLEEKYDYGYVYTENPILFSKRILTKIELNEKSVIDSDIDRLSDDTKELVDAIKNETFDEDKNIPKSKVARLSSLEVIVQCYNFINILYRNGSDFRKALSGPDNQLYRVNALECLKYIYEVSISRPMVDGEYEVFKNAINILFHMIQGRSFREIVGIRFSYVSSRDNKLTKVANFSQPAETLPNIKLKKYGLFKKGHSADKVSYDTIVFDTYDYMDRVISYSLSDVFIAAFKIYGEITGDDRSISVINLFKYGTANQKNILLMRYGFPPEVVDEISPCVDSLDENNIIFNDKVYLLGKDIYDLIEWYLP